MPRITCDRLEPSAGRKESLGKVHVRVSLEQAAEDSSKASLRLSDFDILEVSATSLS
jgi:hypothetical protein